MVSREYQDIDSYTQFIRRIKKIVYHYIENGEYKTYSIDSKDYTTYEDLRNQVANLNQSNKDFVELSETEQLEIPFYYDDSESHLNE